MRRRLRQNADAVMLMHLDRLEQQACSQGDHRSGL
jgi:hypothetical protein